MSTVGLLHPGEMGAAIGAALVGAGHEVLWASAGRSAATAARAEAARILDAGTVAELARRSDVVLSVVPPSESVAVAESVPPFDGIYLDANAIAPHTARRVADVVSGAGALRADATSARSTRGGTARPVDGGIVGAPPRTDRPVSLFVSGLSCDTERIAALFAGTPVRVIVAGERIGDASAVKVAYAGWTKGSAALLLAIREYARRAGVEPVLLAEWERSQPGLPDRWDAAEVSAATKGWRWTGEMDEIAAALAAEGLPAGFHAAASAVFGARPRPST